jgi:tRNA nucleotidyltransferase/poly(A) polymerase
MNKDEIYNIILKISKENYISEPFVVGGTPRDIYRGEEDSNPDIDITTNDADILRLAILAADSLKLRFHLFNDGHVSVYVAEPEESYALDFSSNFVSKDAIAYIDRELRHVANSPKLYEVYSRDFTMNTLHKRLLSDEIIDPTNMGMKDIDNKIIRTVVPPNITFYDDKRRLWRAIRFAAKFNFKIDDKIIDYVKSVRDEFTGEGKWGKAGPGRKVSDQFVSTSVGEALKYNPELTMHYINEMDLLPAVPLSGRFKEEIINRKLVNKYLDDVINLSEYELSVL